MTTTEEFFGFSQKKVDKVQVPAEAETEAETPDLKKRLADITGFNIQ
jgi:hypothetical protein